MRFVLEFPVPSSALRYMIRFILASSLTLVLLTLFRKQLWQNLLPKEVPRAKDIDFEKLGNSYSFTGGKQLFNRKLVETYCVLSCSTRQYQERYITSCDSSCPQT